MIQLDFRNPCHRFLRSVFNSALNIILALYPHKSRRDFFALGAFLPLTARQRVAILVRTAATPNMKDPSIITISDSFHVMHVPPLFSFRKGVSDECTCLADLGQPRESVIMAHLPSDCC